MRNRGRNTIKYKVVMALRHFSIRVFGAHFCEFIAAIALFAAVFIILPNLLF